MYPLIVGLLAGAALVAATPAWAGNDTGLTPTGFNSHGAAPGVCQYLTAPCGGDFSGAEHYDSTAPPTS